MSGKPKLDLIDLFIRARELHEAALIAYWKPGEDYHIDAVKREVARTKEAIAAFEAQLERNADESESSRYEARCSREHEMGRVW